MVSALRARAEARFSEIERRQRKAMSEEQAEKAAVDANTARLKALRLAKEDDDRRSAEAVKLAKTEALLKRRSKS